MFILYACMQVYTALEEGPAEPSPSSEEPSLLQPPSAVVDGCAYSYNISLSQVRLVRFAMHM